MTTNTSIANINIVVISGISITTNTTIIIKPSILNNDSTISNHAMIISIITYINNINSNGNVTGIDIIT